VTVTALAEPDEHNLERAQRLVPGAKAFPGVEEMLSSAALDAVAICLPNALHAQACVAAFARGLHVYLEKPLAASLCEGRAILDAWRKAASVGMIGFNYRFNPLYESARRCVQSGELGEIVAMRSVFSLPTHEIPAWKSGESAGGGVLFDVGSHHVDLAHHFSGSNVRSVLARPAVEDGRWESAVLEMRLANGAVVQSFFSLAAVEDDRIEIYGRAGKLAVDRHRSLTTELRGATHQSARADRLRHLVRSVARVPYLLEKRRSPAFEPSYPVAWRAFVAAVREGKPVSPDLEDGYRSLAVIQAAMESAAGGKWIEVAGEFAVTYSSSGKPDRDT
jgi:predicted dehydrogenase